MHVQLRPLSEQVIVITGASSGIGLVTARMACFADVAFADGQVRLAREP
ncbi:short chain dehydrogenase [Aquisphaera giovannonii]|uniref:Short chain dehydrogenase n=1 Tax=Aquisphaera giovannonii TaxID=406548 RepID=A0A5B9WF14_9BACT|nr:hypothetical protein [Aquisphaera giovannonii]QEH38541.1 short chain dehydrogenase [Aquisphaera giovannonii]